jgi:acyl transferase domain-containing protein
LKEVDRDALRHLHAIEPVFQRLFDEFDITLRDHLQRTEQPLCGLTDCLNDACDRPEMRALLPFALQVGLVRLWRSWGMTPDAVLGFGLGQFTASCAAGGLCERDALILLYERERSQRGDASDLDAFESFADQFNYYPPNLPLICSVSGNVVPVHRSLGGSYWREQSGAQPRVRESVDSLAGTGCDYVVEMGTPRVATSEETQAWEAFPAQRLCCVTSTRSATRDLLATLGSLYVAGANPDWSAFSGPWPRQPVSLPSYPFQRKRYWITDVSLYEQKEPADA